MLSVISDLKPEHIICLGDLLEANASSRWPEEYPWTLKDEFDSANDYLKRIRYAGGNDCTYWWLLGNHDANLQSVNRIDSKIRGLCNPLDPKNVPEVDFWRVPCDHVYDPRLGVLRLGQVSFFHGYEASVSADEMQAYIMGMPFGLTISGHTHRPARVTKARRTKRVPLPYYYANAGCMRLLKPDYAKRALTVEWGQAVVIGEFEKWRYSKSMIPNEPLWHAETIIYQTGIGYSDPSQEWKPVR